jgi:hypothetical protein
MTKQVLIAHAEGEEGLAEKLSAPIRDAGYDVVHRGTTLVGDSITEEASKVLSAGAPIVLCGTVAAIGTGWAHFLVKAARQNHHQTRIFAVQMERNAYVEILSLDEVVARYWQDPAKAERDLIRALKKFYPLEGDSGSVPERYDAERRYRELALESCDIIDLANLPETDRHIATRQLELRRLFVPLRVRVEIAPGLEEGDTKLEAIEKRRAALQQGLAPDGGVPERIPVGHRLQASRRLVILGDPGAGKTTMLRWIATAYLLRLKRDPDWRGLPDVETLPDEDWLPIIIRCRDLDSTSLTGSIDDALRHTLRKRELGDREAGALLDALKERLRNGQALLLLDGLDEVTIPSLRARFCQQLESFHIAYPDACIIATSRIVGYREMGYRIGRGFEHVTVADLSKEDKDEFARRWSFLIEPPERRETAAAELIQDIHSTDRVERLTGNPMLLTTLALVRRKVGKLPRRRADLYWEAVQVLLNWRSEVDEPIDPYEALPQLEYIAYAMCDRGVQQLREDEIIELFDRMREEYPQIHALKKHSSEEFLRLLERRTGILIEAGHVRHLGRPAPIFEFRHLTIQEYLAALALVDGRFPGRDRARTLAENVAPLAGRISKPENNFWVFNQDAAVTESWREALRLCVASCKDDDVEDVLLAIAAPREGEDAAVTARPRAVEAALCLADEPNVNEETARIVLQTFAGQVGGIDGVDLVPMRTSATAAARELVSSRWSIILRHVLLEEFCKRDSVDYFGVSELFALVTRLSSSEESADLDQWVAEQAARVETGGGSEPIDAALSMGGMTDNRKIQPTEGLIVGLLRMLSASPPAAHAAARALFAFSAASPIRAKTWQSSPASLGSIISVVGSPAADSKALVFLMQILGSERDERAVDVLISRLGDKEEEIRLRAAEALGNIGSVQAVESLLTHLDGQNERLQRIVISALGKIGDARAVEPLIARLDEPDKDVKVAVINALGQIGDARSIKVMEDELSSQNLEVRTAALRMLLQAREDETARKLLTKDFDGGYPFLDPGKVLGEERVEEAARKLGISADDARRRYEELADKYSLNLAWRRQGVIAEGREENEAH